jgi:osmotically-inducible protein OsmY
MSNYYPALLITLALITVGGCEQTTQNTSHEKSVKHIDDNVITARVKAAIQSAPALKLAEINVETDKGVVQMTSVVKSQSDIWDMSRAVELASRVEGVNYVKHDMRVDKKPGSDSNLR